jgi:hypothetical protein
MCVVEVPYSPTAQHNPPGSSRRNGFAAPSTSAAAAASTAHAVGICVLDISSGVCRVGCFSTADDPARSALAVALLMCDPSEAVAVRNSLAGATVTLLKSHFEVKAAAGSAFGSSSGDGHSGDKSDGHTLGMSWLPLSAAAVLSNPTGAVLQSALNGAQLQELQHIAAQAAAAVSGTSTSSGSSSSRGYSNQPGGAFEAAATAVLAAVAVGVKQLERCSLLQDVLPTVEVQPLEAPTAHAGVQPGAVHKSMSTYQHAIVSLVNTSKAFGLFPIREVAPPTSRITPSAAYKASVLHLTMLPASLESFCVLISLFCRV